MKKNHLRTQVLLSLAIMLIPLIFSVVVCATLFGVVGDSLKKSEKITFDNVVRVFEEDVKTTVSRLQSMTNREPFKTISLLDNLTEIDDTDYITFTQSLKDIKNNFTVLDKVGFIFSSGFAIADDFAAEMDMFIGDMYYLTGIDEDTLLEIFTTKHGLDFYLYGDKTHSICIFDINNTVYRYDGKIMLIINNDLLKRYISEHLGTDAKFFFSVFDKENRGIEYNTFNISEKEYKNNLHIEEGYYTGISYKYAVPSSEYDYVYIPVIILMSASIILATGIATILLIRRIKKNYKPVENLKEKFNRFGEAGAQESDFEFIDRSVDRLIQQHSDDKEWINRNRMVMQNNVLLRMLRGLPLPDTTENLCKEYGFQLFSSIITVVAIGSREIAERIERMESEEAINGRLALSIGRQQLAEKHFVPHFKACYKVDGEVGSYLIVCGELSDDKTEHLNKIKECAREYQLDVMKTYAFYVNFAISNTIDSPTKLHSAYRHAEDAQTFGSILGSDNEIIDYAQVKPNTGTLKVDLSAYKKLQGYIRDKEFEKANEQMSEIVKQELENLSKEELKCRIYSLVDRLNTELLNVTASFDKEFLQELNFTATLLATKSVKSLLANAQKVFASLTEYVKNNASENTEWIGRVKADIKENYADSNLSVSSLADKYGFSLSYFSRVFKKETGKGVFEYIQAQRIKNAKILLEEGKSVAEVAIAVGFLDSVPFIKAFKKSEGYTPAQHKHK